MSFILIYSIFMPTRMFFSLQFVIVYIYKKLHEKFSLHITILKKDTNSDSTDEINIEEIILVPKQWRILPAVSRVETHTIRSLGKSSKNWAIFCPSLLPRFWSAVSKFLDMR